MKKQLIVSLMIVTFLAGSVGPIFAQDASPVTNAQGQTYEQWKAEYDRIAEENRKIDENNKQIDEQNKKNQEEYDRQMQEYNTAQKDREERYKRIMERGKAPPQITVPVVQKVYIAAPTPTPTPVVTILVGQKSDKIDEEISKKETADIERINVALKDKNISIKKEASDLIIMTDQNVSAEIHFPLIVNVETKEIQVITSNGTKTLSTLPNQAVENAKQNNGLTEITGTTIRLEEFNKQPIYVITGKKTFKVFKVISITRTLTKYISIEDGKIVASPQDVLTSLVQKLSF